MNKIREYKRTDEVLDSCPECNFPLQVIYSKKTSRHYLVCGRGKDQCGFIANAEKTRTGWRIAQGERIVKIDCPVCYRDMKEIKTKAGDLILVCSTGREKCAGVIFAPEKDVLGKCPDCGQGYVYRSKTKTGKKLRKCSNRGCEFVEWVSEAEDKKDQRKKGGSGPIKRSGVYTRAEEPLKGEEGD